MGIIDQLQAFCNTAGRPRYECARLLDLQPSHLSEFLSGKRVPTRLRARDLAARLEGLRAGPKKKSKKLL